MGDTPNNIGAHPPSGGDSEGAKPAAARQEPKKIVRLLTVVAYMMSVSMAAIMLSAYYVFLWNPKEHQPTMTGPLRLVAPDPAPAPHPGHYALPDNLPLSAAGGLNPNQMGNSVNESQDIQMMAETPRALPAQEQPTTPLSRLTQHLLDLSPDNYTLPVPTHS